MEIKSRREVLDDVIRDAKKHPKGWKAVFGKDKERLSRDYYIFNPKTGIYLLKEYQKNPFDVRGTGGKIARNVDEDIEADISKYAGDFGIIQGDIKKISKNILKGIHPQDIFDSAIKGENEDMGISMPMRGHASASKDSFTHLHSTLSTKQKRIDSKFEKMATDDGLYDSYG